MLLPYHVDVPMVRLPIANWILIAVTCVISLAALLDSFPEREGLTPQEPSDFRKSVPKQDRRPADSKPVSRVRETQFGAPPPPPWSSAGASPHRASLAARGWS